jgi:Family of unknown function (DUF6281)
MARLLAAATIAGLALGVGGAAADSTAGAKCLYSVVYDGSSYHYVSGATVEAGPRVGRALRQGCNDTGGPPPPPTPVEVFRFGTASPRVALVVRQNRQPDLIVAVPGRCFGSAAHRDRLRCLQTELRFRGRGYTAVRGLALAAARPLGHGTIRGRPVRLRALQGIDSRSAVLLDRTRELFVAHRRCELLPSSDLARCLRSPLWLDIAGEGRSRTATIDRAGSLLRSAGLPLYVAENMIADQIASPTDHRLSPAGRLTVDGRGRGSARISVADSAVFGLLAVVAQLPNGRMAVVGGFWNAPRRD